MLRFLAFAFFLALSPLTSHADSASRMHADSAFMFAKKENWNDAFLHAKESGDPLVGRIVTWMHCRSPNSAATFEEIHTFLKKNEDWPDVKSIRIRAEQALLREQIDATTARAFLTAYPPQSGAGKIALAEASGGNPALIREGWRDGDFDENTETRLLETYGTLLKAQDHAARASRLLWEDKSTAASRILPLLSADDRILMQTRLALMRGENRAQALVVEVPPAKMHDSGLIYERLRLYNKKEMAQAAENMLLSAPGEVPFPEKWWPIREKYVRSALEMEDYPRALKLLNNHGQKDGKTLMEALWLKGWIEIKFLKDPQSAYKDFYTMFQQAQTPISKARAAYWAGRAADRNGNPEIGQNWLVQAKAFPTAFYGQLAAQKLNPKAPLALAPSATLSEEDRRAYARKELPRAIILLLDADEKELAYKFTLHLVDTAKTSKEAALAADLGIGAGHREDGVKAAKRAQQKQFTLVKAGYPLIKLPGGIGIEKALALSITRQESEFDSKAVSPSNAQGLMQLLPGTAKETARKLGMAYGDGRLFEPEYNLTLGSAYLDKLIGQFDGSYVKAIAAYNAGPGRVRQWEGVLGEPAGDADKAVDWIEGIPYSETRNYVQRVLENLQVYRHLLGKSEPLKLAEDLKR